MEITIKDLRHWNDDFKEEDLEKRIVKLKTICSGGCSLRYAESSSGNTPHIQSMKG